MKIKRPMLIAVIGYIIGILWGLYTHLSIAPFYILIIVIYLIKRKINKHTKRNFKLFSYTRYKRYIKLFLNLKIFYLIIIISIISNSIILLKEKNYHNIYEIPKEIEVEGVITENKDEKQYSNFYVINSLKINNDSQKVNFKFYISVDKKEKQQLEYGDKIVIKGIYQKPQFSRNYNGFDYSSYLKTKNIYGTINVKKINILEKNCANKILTFANNINLKIKEKSKNRLTEEEYQIFCGLILGDTKNLEENIKEDFRLSSMSHILAVSGLHISYIIIGVNIFTKKIFGKKFGSLVTSIFLILYMCMVGFYPSVIRATIMGISMLLSDIIAHRKNDFISSISCSILIILISNPYAIFNIGFQLSYAGVIGIIMFNTNMYMLLNCIKIKNKKWKYKIKNTTKNIIDKIKKNISVIISAQIFVIPISIYHFNSLNIYFILSNVLINYLVGPTIIISIIYSILVFFNLNTANVVLCFLKLGINSLIQISKMVSNLPLSQIYIKTYITKISFLILIFLIIANLIYGILKLKKPNNTQLRVVNICNLIKYKINNIRRKNKSTIIKLMLIITSMLINLLKLPNNLQIHFVDVGQGDCTFVETPYHKSILIDGGGSTDEKNNIGKNTLIPYILDRGYTKIDYVIISHFDDDHVKGILSVLENLEIGEVVIAKQFTISENYNNFIDIIKDKKLKVKIVKANDRINIEKDLIFEIIWPEDKQLDKNPLNNNSIVGILKYKNFSCLFTGDIESLAEKEILKTNININSTVLKVAHHGSKTSSLEEFIKKVSPKIAMIGVGENNKFGHPNEVTLDILEKNKCKIYRTDQNGEITIKVLNNERINIEKYIK